MEQEQQGAMGACRPEYDTVSWRSPQQFAPSVDIGAIHKRRDGREWLVQNVDYEPTLDVDWCWVTVYYMIHEDAAFMAERIRKAKEQNRYFVSKHLWERGPVGPS